MHIPFNLFIMRPCNQTESDRISNVTHFHFNMKRGLKQVIGLWSFSYAPNVFHYAVIKSVNEQHVPKPHLQKVFGDLYTMNKINWTRSCFGSLAKDIKIRIINKTPPVVTTDAQRTSKKTLITQCPRERLKSAIYL